MKDQQNLQSVSSREWFSAPTVGPNKTNGLQAILEPAVQARLAFTVSETAAMLGLSPKSIRRLLDLGLLRASKALRHKVIPKSEIHRFLNESIK